jgi:hypothetical protein
VIDCIDFDSLYQLEHLLWATLEHCDVPPVDVEALASEWIGNALDQLRDDPRRSVTTAFGAPCGLCEAEARHHAPAGATNKGGARVPQEGVS